MRLFYQNKEYQDVLDMRKVVLDINYNEKGVSKFSKKTEMLQVWSPRPLPEADAWYVIEESDQLALNLVASKQQDNGEYTAIFETIQRA